jgi:hypothetical protein
MGKLISAGVAAIALTVTGLAVAAVATDTYTYRAALTSGVEVPKAKAPASAKGAFTATVTVNGTASTLKWTLTFRGLSGKALAAHIHKGKPGTAGAVVVPLCGPCTSGKKGRATITKSVATLLQRGTAYVNLHTAKNAAGEIRGQVKFVKKSSTTEDPPPDDGGGGSGGGGGGEPPPGY